jgi:hypothetical protein
MSQSATQTAAERQIAEFMAAERESLRPATRAVHLACSGRSETWEKWPERV